MSDHWETFPCTIGERQGFITYDHGIREELEALPFKSYTRYALALRDPDDRGLPQGAEFDALNKAEDLLTDEIGKPRGVNVGRITTDGCRYLVYYTQLDQAQAEEIGRRVAASSGYRIDLAHRHDPEYDGYWKELFPTDDDWQVIEDIRVETALRDRGDSLSEARPVTHWAYFPRVEDREQFLQAVAARFEEVEVYESPDSDAGVYAAKLHHTSLPDHRSMNAITLLLSREARKTGGDYDGWETEVRAG